MLWLGFSVLMLVHLERFEVSAWLRISLSCRCLDLRAEHLHLGGDGFPHDMTAAIRYILRLIRQLLGASLVHITLVANDNLVWLLWLVLSIIDVHQAVLCDLCLWTLHFGWINLNWLRRVARVRSLGWYNRYHRLVCRLSSIYVHRMMMWKGALFIVWLRWVELLGDGRLQRMALLMTVWLTSIDRHLIQ